MANKTKLKFEELFEKMELNGSEIPKHKTAAKVAKQHSEQSQFLNKIEETKSEGQFNEMYDSYEQEEAHQKAKFAPNHLPSGDTKVEDGEDYSDDDLESLGLKDAKTDEEVDAEDQEVEITPEEKSKFAKLFKAAMKDFKSEDGEHSEEKSEEEHHKSLDDKMKALEDKALMAKMDKAAKEEDSEEQECEHCDPEDEYCDHCGVEEEEDDKEHDEEHDEEDVVEENRFEKAWSSMNKKRVQEEGIYSALDSQDQLHSDGTVTPKPKKDEDAECDHEDAEEEKNKHEDKDHTPEDHYGHEGAAYDLKDSEVSDEDADEDTEEEDDKDVVEEGVMSYMSQVTKVDAMLSAPESPVALVEESTVVEVKPTERETYNGEKVMVEGYAGGLTKALK